MINGEKDQLGNAAILNICKRNITCHAALILRVFFFSKTRNIVAFPNIYQLFISKVVHESTESKITFCDSSMS